jgi:hypothetical protein
VTFDEMMDDLFLGCAIAAYVEEARAVQGWPDSERVKQRAYKLYEAALQRKQAN